MMMSSVFLRKETKYILNSKSYETLLFIMRAHMKRDKYGRQTVNNVYFDNDSYELISRSIEKPVYKEKVRMRVYGRPDETSPAFFEIKKKYDGVVFKRRISTDVGAMQRYIDEGRPIDDSQIFREIDYVYRIKKLSPKVVLAYEREAYYCSYDENLRITFDTGIRFRTDFLDITKKAPMTFLTGGAVVLMEIKCLLGYPRWLIDFLTRNGIYKTSFSKYGKVYTDAILCDSEAKLKEKILCSV